MRLLELQRGEETRRVGFAPDAAVLEGLRHDMAAGQQSLRQRLQGLADDSASVHMTVARLQRETRGAAEDIAALRTQVGVCVHLCLIFVSHVTSCSRQVSKSQTSTDIAIAQLQAQCRALEQSLRPAAREGRARDSLDSDSEIDADHTRVQSYTRRGRGAQARGSAQPRGRAVPTSAFHTTHDSDSSDLEASHFTTTGVDTTAITSP